MKNREKMCFFLAVVCTTAPFTQCNKSCDRSSL